MSLKRYVADFCSNRNKCNNFRSILLFLKNTVKMWLTAIDTLTKNRYNSIRGMFDFCQSFHFCGLYTAYS